METDHGRIEVSLLESIEDLVSKLPDPKIADVALSAADVDNGGKISVCLFVAKGYITHHKMIERFLNQELNEYAIMIGGLSFNFVPTAISRQGNDVTYQIKGIVTKP